MPGFIAHIVYGQKILKHNNISSFIYLIGNLYPDIRYLGVIDRESTHINLDNDAWNKVSTLISSEEVDLDLFKKGFYSIIFFTRGGLTNFHSLTKIACWEW